MYEACLKGNETDPTLLQRYTNLSPYLKRMHVYTYLIYFNSTTIRELTSQRSFIKSYAITRNSIWFNVILVWLRIA